MSLSIPFLALALLAPGPVGPDGEALEALAEGVLGAVPPPALAEEWSRWSGNLGVGASTRLANDSPRRFDASGELGHRGQQDRWRADGFLHYADQLDAQGARSVRERRVGGALQYDRFVDEREYLLWNASGERNHKANLDLRLTSGVGYGYQLEDSESFDASAELGAGWFYQDFETFSPEDRTSGRLAIAWAWEPGKPWSLDQRFEHYPSLESAADFLSRLKSQVRYVIAESWYALASWRFQWDNEPAAQETNEDHDVTLTVGWSF